MVSGRGSSWPAIEFTGAVMISTITTKLQQEAEYLMWICLRVSLVFLLLPTTTLGQSNPTEEPLGFASFLMRQGEYYRAITEFNRVLYLSSSADHESRSAAILGIGQALHAGQRYERAGEWLWPRLGELSAAGRLDDGVELMSRSFLDANTGSRLLLLTSEPIFPVQEALFYRPLALANTGNWQDAYQGFLDVPSQSRYGSMAALNADFANNALDASWKSPAKAGWLGIIPGLGYLYADHKQTAAASFIVNTVFWFATYQAFDADQNVLGGFLAVISVSWYASNIYGSVQAAKRYNSRLQSDLWSPIQY